MSLDTTACRVCGLPYSSHPTCHLCGGLSGRKHDTHLRNTVKGHPVCPSCFLWAELNPDEIGHFFRLYGKAGATGNIEEEL